MRNKPSSPRPEPVRTIGVVANPHKPRAREVIEHIMRTGERLGIAVRVIAEVAEQLALDVPTIARCDLADACDAIIACGGDGTILQAARLVAENPKPILGVNLGVLGFLAELPPERVEEGLTRIAEGQFTVEPRMTLSASFDEDDPSLPALNDIIIAKSNQSRIISIELYDEGNWVNTYVGDGLILATPTGSTAYALAAGGPIVTPDVDAIVAAPICPHSLTVRPMIFPGSARLDVRVIGAPESTILLTADGQAPRVLASRQVVHVRRGERDAQLLHLGTVSYYDILRQKLHWGMDKSLQ